MKLYTARFNSAGLYACNIANVVDAINNMVEQSLA